MKTKTKVKYLSVSVVIYLILIGALGYYAWNLNQKVEYLGYFSLILRSPAAIRA